LKSLLLLWSKLADELASWCCTSAQMDRKTVHLRCKHEGLSFLTITLPEFGKDTQKCLDQGQVDRRSFTGFQWKRGLPLFLGGFLDRVFDRDTGLLLADPCIDSIFAIRQLTLMFSKISIPCSDARERKAMREFLQCEQDVRDADVQRSQENYRDFERISAMLYSTSFSEVDRKVYYGELVPKHGPGATADKLSGNAKYRQSEWTARLEDILPSGEFLLPNWSFYDQLTNIDILEPGAERPVRVISVPKTLKTPRIIGIEPTAMQYAQQAILPAFLEAIQPKAGRQNDYLSSFIGFDDQVPNQELARLGSLNRDLATLDLSEASDRVSNQLVRSLFRHWPHLSKAVDACRSRKADVHGQGVVRLAKFASMGSALCFPVEAMVFLAIIFIGIEKELNTPLTLRIVKQFQGRVRVYGDDIIIPVEYVRSVVSALEAFGFLVNTSKSFWTGRFRESCGRDYYSGHDVSVVKVRHMIPTQRTDATGVISMISLRNQLYHVGCWQTCRWLDDRIRELIRHFPVVLSTSPVQGRESVLGFETQRESQTLHSPLVKGYVVKSSIPENSLDDQGALLKFFLKRGGLPSVDRKHLERSGRPQRVDIKLRWASPI